MRRIEKFVQETPASVWLHLVQEGHTDIIILGVFGNEGRNTLATSEYNWDVVSGMIKIDHGLDAPTGYVLYEYDDGTQEAAPGIVINNNLTCAGGTTPCGSTF